MPDGASDDGRRGEPSVDESKPSGAREAVHLHKKSLDARRGRKFQASIAAIQATQKISQENGSTCWLCQCVHPDTAFLGGLRCPKGHRMCVECCDTFVETVLEDLPQGPYPPECPECEEPFAAVNFESRLSMPERQILGESLSKRTRDSVLQQWEKSEEETPTDPYFVLGLPRTASHADIQSAYLANMEQLSVDASVSARGVSMILARRCRLAYVLLIGESRERLDMDFEERAKDNTRAKLRYGNGFYEGGVDTQNLGMSEHAQRSGKGVTIQANGEMYEGQYRADMKAGIGLLMWRSGDVYVGSFKDDRMSGMGCFFSKDSSYIGEFEQGMQHGYGFQEWGDGSCYAGQFSEGLRHGRGMLRSSGSSTGYYGMWRENFMHGEGRLEAGDGTNYTGQFQTGLFHGSGRLTLPNADVYEGRFAKGRREGEGSQQWVSGDTYKGDFKDNLQHGAGVHARPGGFEYSGQWQGAVAHGYGELSVKTEEGAFEYKGGWDSGRRSGNGEAAWPSGSYYRGSFYKDKVHGEGTFEWPNRSRLAGTFAEGEMVAVSADPAVAMASDDKDVL